MAVVVPRHCLLLEALPFRFGKVPGRGARMAAALGLGLQGAN